MKLLITALFVYVAFLAQAGEIFDYALQHAQENREHETNRLDARMQAQRTYEEIGSTNFGVTEIGIERTGCFGDCPSYEFIVKDDGTFRYQGYSHTERKGNFTGKISVWQYNRLAKFIKESKYKDLKNDYRLAMTDSSTVFTSVVMNGKRKVISNYAEAGPTSLWAVQVLIDNLLVGADWDPPKKGGENEK